jgi:hypothetical protein
MMTPDGEDGGNETPRPVSAITRLAQEAQAMRSSCPPASNSPQGNRDVTANFIAATQQLPPGELVKDEDFTLFEAVGALEVSETTPFYASTLLAYPLSPFASRVPYHL